jgi:lycopene beta-cyclase
LAGGGLAGLSLALQLTRSPLHDSSMLIIDRESKTRNDRTWAFWTDRPTPFDGIVQREWNKVHFAGAGFEKDIDLGAYIYRLVRGIDLYHYVHEQLAAHANVEFVKGNVERIEDAAEGARVFANGEAYGARWVFDSRYSVKAFKPEGAGCHYLPQHFEGWEIETPGDAFDPRAATLLDFRTPQKNVMRFFYVLPFSERRALVEYVTLGPDNYGAALKSYLENVLGIRDYRVVATEGGVNPLTDYVFPRRAGDRVMNIGTRGGRVKPSTGYAFLRIQRDSAAIVRSLLANGQPFGVPPDSRRYRFYDALMLEVMQRHGGEIKPLFSALFKNNPIARVFRFLDEVASPAENSLLIASLPPKLFLRAMFRMNVSRRVPLGFPRLP